MGESDAPPGAAERRPPLYGWCTLLWCNGQQSCSSIWQSWRMLSLRGSRCRTSKTGSRGTHELSKLEYVLPVFVTTLQCGLLAKESEKGNVFLREMVCCLKMRKNRMWAAVILFSPTLSFCPTMSRVGRPTPAWEPHKVRYQRSTRVDTLRHSFHG